MDTIKVLVGSIVATSNATNDRTREVEFEGMELAELREFGTGREGVRMNLMRDELEKLKACESEWEWNKVCDAIKAARDGQYPPDWWAKVMLSGLGQCVASKWGSDLKLESRPFKPK